MGAELDYGGRKLLHSSGEAKLWGRMGGEFNFFSSFLSSFLAPVLSTISSFTLLPIGYFSLYLGILPGLLSSVSQGNGKNSPPETRQDQTHLPTMR